MPDNKLEYVLSIDPDTRKANLALKELADKTDQTSAKIGRAIGGRAGEDVSRIATSLSPEGQANYLSALVERAKPALERNRLYHEREAEKARSAERAKFMGGLGRAAAGEAIGEIGGLGGIGAMVAGGVTPAAIVTAGVEIIRKPFELMASYATMNARALQSLHTPLGTAAAGFERSTYWLGKIPLVGGYLAEMKQAEKQEAETRLGYARLTQPGMAAQLDWAQENRRAAAGLGAARQIPARIRAEEMANRADTAMDRLFQQMEEAQRRGEFNIAQVASSVSPMAREMRVLRAISYAAEKPGGMDRATQADLLGQYRRETGRDLVAGTMAARPAQIMDAESMMNQLYEAGASMGVEGGPQGASGIAALVELAQVGRDLIETMRANLANDPSGASMRRVLDRAVADRPELGGYINLTP